MKEVYALELLPKETRIKFNEAARKELFKDKINPMKTLKLHRNTVNSWIRGEYNPSLEQLEKLAIDVKSNWKKIEIIDLEGGKKKFLIPEYLPLDKLSWLLGILDGDGLVEKNHRIGIVNQDTNLIKDFIETCKEVFGLDYKDFSAEVVWNKSINVYDEIKLPIENIRVNTSSNNAYKSNRPVIKVVINSKILYSVMENFRNFMQTEINTSPNKFALYVRGLMDSDGSFARKNIYLTQKLNNRNMVRMITVKKILDNLKISNNGIKGPNSKNMIYIYLNNSKENLIKYNNFIGFNSISKREKLSTLLS